MGNGYGEGLGKWGPRLLTDSSQLGLGIGLENGKGAVRWESAKERIGEKDLGQE